MRVALLLAGGASRRFGRQDKLLAPLQGRPLILHALGQARASGAVRVIVVAPRRDARLTAVLRRAGVRPVLAPPGGHATIGDSLRSGLAALRPCEREILLFLADMPFAACPETMRLRGGADMVRPFFGGRPAHPVLVRRSAADTAGSGADGLASAIDRDRVARVQGHPGNLIDVDTRAALRRLAMRPIAPARRFRPQRRAR